MAPKRSGSSQKGGSASKKMKLSAPGSLDHMTLPEELEGEIDFKPDCKTTDGLPWNLKIVSWNVNGIRAVLKSKKLHYLKFEDPDIVCLQETKCAEEDFPEEAKFLGYHKYFNSAQKKGYSSTAVFSKVKPVSVTYGIDIPEHDNEGRVITAEYESFYLVNVYVPNSGQKTVRLPYRRKWNTDFLAYCQNLDSRKPVIVAGDLNVAHTEVDLANPKTNTKNSGFTAEEREDFTTWLDSGFVDSFRHFHPDQTGAYTFWTYMANARKRNVGWRIDYFVVSKRFVDRIAASMIREKVMGSDHCPIMLLCADPGSNGTSTSGPGREEEASVEKESGGEKEKKEEEEEKEQKKKEEEEKEKKEEDVEDKEKKEENQENIENEKNVENVEPKEETESSVKEGKTVENGSNGSTNVSVEN
ncbi:hypothetical protein ACHWQZ_G000063 [Mnemiopsis leidyi]